MNVSSVTDSPVRDQRQFVLDIAADNRWTTTSSCSS